jgi:hypothetical protein
MLFLDHPQTPHIFAAAMQLDLILDSCKLITLSDADSRLFKLEVIRPAFEALRWLAEHRFADEPHIVVGIAELEQQVEQLARLPLFDPVFHDGSESRCPVCGVRPKPPYKYEPISFCSPCLQVIGPGLQRVQSREEGFGIDSI